MLCLEISIYNYYKRSLVAVNGYVIDIMFFLMLKFFRLGLLMCLQKGKFPFCIVIEWFCLLRLLLAYTVR